MASPIDSFAETNTFRRRLRRTVVATCSRGSLLQSDVVAEGMKGTAWAPTIRASSDGSTGAFAATIAELSHGEGLAGTQNVLAGSARYQRGPLLGEGGMGRVVEARDLQFGRVVAMKEVLQASTSLVARFTYETLVTANLEHPGIPAVYERGTTAEGLPFYTMKLVRGRTLSAAIEEAKGIDERLKLLPHVIRTAQTLAYAHEQGVIHRDIKPDNVLLGRHGETVLLDWGIAKVRGLTSHDSETQAVDEETNALGKMGALANRTRQGAVLGTPAYMAPEQAAGKIDELDERTDVFALGALLYHLLAGRAPFDGLTLEALLLSTMNSDFPPVLSLEPKAPPALVVICEKAMANDPAQRFATAAAMAEALESALTGALQHHESLVAKYLAASVCVAAFVVGMIGLFWLGRLSSSFQAQGPGAYLVLFQTVLGVILSGLEWYTRGRLKLWPVSLTLALGTFVAALGSAVTGVGLVAHYAAELPADKMLQLVLRGGYEAVGSVSWGSMSALIQLLLIAVLWRNTTLPSVEAR